MRTCKSCEEKESFVQVVAEILKQNYELKSLLRWLYLLIHLHGDEQQKEALSMERSKWERVRQVVTES